MPAEQFLGGGGLAAVLEQVSELPQTAALSFT
jgi:hypothetical protein